MPARVLLLALVSFAALGAADFVAFDRSAMSARLQVERHDEQVEVLPSFAPVLASAPLPSPTATPLPPPIWPPPDARGGAHTTPPLALVSPHPAPSPLSALWLSRSDSMNVQAEIHDGRVYVPVVVDARRLFFILDSAGSTTLDTDESPDSQATDVTIPTLQIGDVHFNALAAHVARIRPYAQTYLGAAADGIIGQDVFSRFPVAIDYDTGTVTLYRSGRAAAAARPADAVVLPLELVRGYPTVVASINSIDGTFIVDTGLGGYVTLGANFTRSRRLVRSNEGLSELRLAQPGGEIPGRTVRLQRLGVGSASFDRPPVGIMSAPPEAGGLPDTSGILGADLLKHAYIMIDEPDGTVSFLFRAGSGGAQDYDRSGLWLVNRGGLMVVRSVSRGSPADAARFRDGDAIISVDGSAVGTGDLESVRSRLMQSSTRSVTIVVRRGGSTRRITLTLRALL